MIQNYGIIKSVKIYFRKLKGDEIKLGKKFTLISGHNGTMKSTILGLIIQPFNSSNSKFENKEIFRSLDGDYLEGKFSKNITFAYPEYENKDCLSAEMDLYSNIYENDSYKYKSILRKDSNKLRVYSEKREAGKGYIYNIPVGALYLDRLFPISTMIYNSGENNRNQITNINLNETQKKQYSQWYNSIFPNNQLINSISSIKFSEKNIVNLEFNNRDYRSMSSGEDVTSKILLTILSILNTKELLKENYKGALLVIDEIESSFHPPAAKKLFELLINLSSKHNIQIIATTHSMDLIELISKRIQQSKKDSKTMDDFSLIYLKNYSDKIDVIHNASYVNIYNHFLLEKSNNKKIKVLVEDDEALILLNAFLKPEYKKLIEPKSTKVWCKELLTLNNKDIFEEISRSIILLDGDNRKDLEKLNDNKNDNVFVLPGDKNPENYIADFLNNLNDRDAFWALNENDSYSKLHFSNNIDFNKMDDRNYSKKWFNENKDNWGDSECNNLLELIKTKNHQEIEKFNCDFVECYNKVCEMYLLEKIKINPLLELKEKIYKEENAYFMRNYMNEYFYTLSKEYIGTKFSLKDLDEDLYLDMKFDCMGDKKYRTQDKTNSFRLYIKYHHPNELKPCGNGYFEKIK